jgi:hypothetical protein
MAAKLRRGWGVKAGIGCMAIAARLDRGAVFGPPTKVAIPTEGYLMSRQRHLLVAPWVQTALREPRPCFNLHSH